MDSYKWLYSLETTMLFINSMQYANKQLLSQMQDIIIYIC